MASAAITEIGKNHALKLMFGKSDVEFAYMALGTGISDFTESSPGLTTEVTDAGDNDYERVQLTNTAYGDQGGVTKQIKSEAIFEETNIVNSTEIKELGITTVQDHTAGGDIWWCLCVVPSTTKSSDVSLKFTVITSVS